MQNTGKSRLASLLNFVMSDGNWSSTRRTRQRKTLRMRPMPRSKAKTVHIQSSTNNSKGTIGIQRHRFPDHTKPSSGTCQGATKCTRGSSRCPPKALPGAQLTGSVQQRNSVERKGLCLKDGHLLQNTWSTRVRADFPRSLST